MRIYLDIRIPNDALFRDMSEAMAVQLARVSRHEVSLVRDKSAANVIGTFARAAELQEAAEEYFPGDADFRKIIRTNLCVGRYFSNRAGEITRAQGLGRGHRPLLVVRRRLRPDPRCDHEEGRGQPAPQRC